MHYCLSPFFKNLPNNSCENSLLTFYIYFSCTNISIDVVLLVALFLAGLSKVALNLYYYIYDEINLQYISYYIHENSANFYFFRERLQFYYHLL